MSPQSVQVQLPHIFNQCDNDKKNLIELILTRYE